MGGLSTSGINTAESEHMLHWTIGGIALEFYERLGRHYGTGKPEFYFESSIAERVYLEMLREAGAVLIAKLTTGELAAGDNWFGGQTKSPWDPAVGSSGSSAGRWGLGGERGGCCRRLFA